MTNEVLEIDGSPENAAQRFEDARDLRKQLGNLGLDDAEQQFFILKETSPPRRKTQLWSMEDGSSYYFLNFRVTAMLEQTMADGRPRWTARKERAPKVVVSEHPCFLAPESEIRAELDALGITVRCKSKHPSKFAMEQVASKKHPNSWKAWQAHLKEKQDQADRERQNQQVAAMMALAGNVTGGTRTVSKPAPDPDMEVVTLACDCGWTTEKGNQSLAIHKRLHCPLRASASTT